MSVLETLRQTASGMPDGIRPLVEYSLESFASTRRGCVYLQKLTREYAGGEAARLSPAPERLLEGFRHIDVERARAFVFLESPYPTLGMANGRPFFPQSVQTLWENGGINNSLPAAFQAFLKMLLVAKGLLADPDSDDQVRQAVATVLLEGGPRNVETLFSRASAYGIYFLNASLVYEPARPGTKERNNIGFHEVRWRGFNLEFLEQVREGRSENLPSLYLVGGKAANLVRLIHGRRVTAGFPRHLLPYPSAGNVGTFIMDGALRALFHPADLLGTRFTSVLQRRTHESFKRFRVSLRGFARNGCMRYGRYVLERQHRQH